MVVTVVCRLRWRMVFWWWYISISPVIDVVQGGIDILQGVESLKTEIINTGIDTVADTIIGILPQAEHPVSEIADLGTLTFETSRDTVNGALEVVSV